MHQEAVTVNFRTAALRPQMCQASQSFSQQDAGLAQIQSKCSKNNPHVRFSTGCSLVCQTYNGVNFYDHRSVDHVIDLDACLTGLGGRFGNLVYFLPLPRGYKECTIVHLEMVNILLAIRLFCSLWLGRKVLVRCDNKAVVTVLTSGCTRDPFLSACARNIWYCAAKHDIDMEYVHIKGCDNKVADLLSRWSGSREDWGRLLHHIPNPCWLQTNEEMLTFYPDI